MSNGLSCQWFELTDRTARYLRRYRRGMSDCPVHGFHNAKTRIEDEPRTDLFIRLDDDMPQTDPRWPVACDCGYAFAPTDAWQVFKDHLYRSAVGECLPLSDLPVGAMFDAFWLHGSRDRVGPDGLSVNVIIPGGHQWNIDGRASNCTRPDDDVHKCWVRHGEPRAVPAVLTVDKNGNTCQAGGGSILVPGWHGFLTGGRLVST